MKEKILLIAEKDKDTLGSVRCIDTLVVAANKQGIWLKCTSEDDSNNLFIKQLPVQKTFFIDDHGYLFHPGTLTPVEILHIKTWIPVKQFIPVELPVAAMPAKVNTFIGIRVISSSAERNADALLTSLDAWKAYAEHASSIRLCSLKFAVSENKNVFVIGKPLPSIPGRAYWINKKIALPCGYDLEWNFLMDSIIQKFSSADELMVFNDKSECQKIHYSFFVQATRSAIRLTQVNY
jgi:hypothetical protein